MDLQDIDPLLNEINWDDDDSENDNDNVLMSSLGGADGSGADGSSATGCDADDSDDSDGGATDDGAADDIGGQCNDQDICSIPDQLDIGAEGRSSTEVMSKAPTTTSTGVSAVETKINIRSTYYNNSTNEANDFVGFITTDEPSNINQWGMVMTAPQQALDGSINSIALPSFLDCQTAKKGKTDQGGGWSVIQKERIQRDGEGKGTHAIAKTPAAATAAEDCGRNKEVMAGTGGRDSVPPSFVSNFTDNSSTSTVVAFSTSGTSGVTNASSANSANIALTAFNETKKSNSGLRVRSSCSPPSTELSSLMSATGSKMSSSAATAPSPLMTSVANGALFSLPQTIPHSLQQQQQQKQQQQRPNNHQQSFQSQSLSTQALPQQQNNLQTQSIPQSLHQPFAQSYPHAYAQSLTQQSLSFPQSLSQSFPHLYQQQPQSHSQQTQHPNHQMQPQQNFPLNQWNDFNPHFNHQLNQLNHNHHMHPLAMTSLASCPPYVNVNSSFNSNVSNAMDSRVLSPNTGGSTNVHGASAGNILASGGTTQRNITTGIETDTNVEARSPIANLAGSKSPSHASTNNHNGNISNDSESSKSGKNGNEPTNLLLMQHHHNQSSGSGIGSSVSSIATSGPAAASSQAPLGSSTPTGAIGSTEGAITTRGACASGGQTSSSLCAPFNPSLASDASLSQQDSSYFQWNPLSSGIPSRSEAINEKSNCASKTNHDSCQSTQNKYCHNDTNSSNDNSNVTNGGGGDANVSADNYSLSKSTTSIYPRPPAPLAIHADSTKTSMPKNSTTMSSVMRAATSTNENISMTTNTVARGASVTNTNDNARNALSSAFFHALSSNPTGASNDQNVRNKDMLPSKQSLPSGIGVATCTFRPPANFLNDAQANITSNATTHNPSHHYGMIVNGFHPQVNAQVNPVLPMPNMHVAAVGGMGSETAGLVGIGTSSPSADKNGSTGAGVNGETGGTSGKSSAGTSQFTSAVKSANSVEANNLKGNSSSSLTTIFGSKERARPASAGRASAPAGAVASISGGISFALSSHQNLKSSGPKLNSTVSTNDTGNTNATSSYSVKNSARERNEREQIRAQKITQLIKELRVNMQKGGWKQEMKSKYQTLSQCKEYMEYLHRSHKEKEADIEHTKKLAEEKALIESRSDPESIPDSVTSSLTASSARTMGLRRSTSPSGGSSSDKDSSSSDSRNGHKKRKKSGSSGVNFKEDALLEKRGIGSAYPSKKSRSQREKRKRIEEGGGVSADVGISSTDSSSDDEGGNESPGGKNIAFDKTSSSVSDMTDSNRSSSDGTGMANNNSAIEASGISNPRSSSDAKPGGRYDGDGCGSTQSSSSISSTAAVARGGGSSQRALTHNHYHRLHHHHATGAIVGGSKKNVETDTTKASVKCAHKKKRRGFEYDYKEVFLKSNVPQLIATLSGRIVVWNQFFLFATGLSEREAKRLTIFSIVQPSQLSNLYKMVARALAGNSEESSMKVIPEDGTPESTDKVPLKSVKEEEWEAITLKCTPFPNSKSNEQNISCRDPLYITVALMADEDQSQRCFHCVLTDCPGTNGKFGSVTPEMLALFFTSKEDTCKNSGAKLRERKG